MGTSGEYTGAGGKAGKQVGDGLGGWGDSLPGGTGDSVTTPDQSGGNQKPVTELPPTVVTGLLDLLGPRTSRGGSSDGSQCGRRPRGGGWSLDFRS